ncbi:hypothetical protein [Tenacibaculum halocynthiae]
MQHNKRNDKIIKANILYRISDALVYIAKIYVDINKFLTALQPA